MDLQRLVKAQIVVAVLAGLGIALFLGIYAVLGDSTAPAQRLFTALFIPPLVITILVGGYVLFVRRPKS